MTLSKTTILYIVELALYLPLGPLILFLAFRHGKHGVLGFFYLSAFCFLRFVSDIIFISQRNDTTPSEGAAIVSSIGLSPLLLALAGFIHEEHVYLIRATLSPTRAKQMSKYLWIAQILFHMGAAAGIAIAIVGTINLINDQQPPSTATQGDINSAYSLREAGSVILFLVWATLVAYALWLLKTIHRVASGSRLPTSLLSFAIWISIASLFVGIRTVYGIVYSFDHKSTSLNPITGSFAVKLVFAVLVQLAAATSLTIAAWASRNIRREEHKYQPTRVISLSDNTELMTR